MKISILLAILVLIGATGCASTGGLGQRKGMRNAENVCGVFNAAINAGSVRALKASSVREAAECVRDGVMGDPDSTFAVAKFVIPDLTEDELNSVVSLIEFYDDTRVILPNEPNPDISAAKFVPARYLRMKSAPPNQPH